MKIIDFNTRVTKIMKKTRVQCEIHENHESLRIPNENNEKHENHLIPFENHENYENPRIPYENPEKMKIIKFHLRIMKIITILKL